MKKFLFAAALGLAALAFEASPVFAQRQGGRGNNNFNFQLGNNGRGGLGRGGLPSRGFFPPSRGFPVNNFRFDRGFRNGNADLALALALRQQRGYLPSRGFFNGRGYGNGDAALALALARSRGNYAPAFAFDPCCDVPPAAALYGAGASRSFFLRQESFSTY